MVVQTLSWILTSTLTLVFMATISFVVFHRERLVQRKDLKPSSVVLSSTQDVSKIDITRIYKNDLFNTFKEIVPPAAIEEKINPLPPPPIPLIAPVIQKVLPQFLAPLQITLKGIISSSEEQFNRVIIADNKTKQELLFKVGDKIEDAEIIRINANKVILVRSNGQQEMLFVTQADAQEDPLFLHDKPWDELVKKTGEDAYLVDPHAFIDRISSLAQFIDMLDITTAFQGNKSSGCRIGVIAPESLGVALGFISGDVIISINNISTSVTKDRVAIYNMIKELPLNATVVIKLLRNKEEKIITVVLNTIHKKDEQQRNTQEPKIVVRDEKTQALTNTVVNQSTTQFGPTVQEVQKRDKEAMRNNGGRASMLQRTL